MTALAQSILGGIADPADAVASALERLISEGSSDSVRLEQIVYWEARALRTNTLRERKRESPFGLLTDLALLEERIEDERAAKGQPLTQDTLSVGQPLTFETITFSQGFDRAVRDLPDNERDAYILTDLRGITDRAAADLLGISHMTVNRRSKAATIRLREELAA